MRFFRQIPGGWVGLTGARLATQALAALFTFLIARRLGSAGFGIYALVAATVFFGNTLTTFGSDMFLIRDIAARRRFTSLPAALLLQLALSLLFICIVWLGAHLWVGSLDDAALALRIYSLALLPLSFYTVFSSVLRGVERMGAYALLSLSSALLPVLWVAVWPAGLVSLVAGLLGVQVLLTLLAGWMCARLVPGLGRNWRFSGPDALSLLRACAPLALLACLAVIYQKLGLYLVAGLVGAASAGAWAAAARVLDASKTLHIAIFTALYPARVRGADHPWRTRGLLVALAALFAGFLSVGAAPLTFCLFGPGFSDAVAVLQVLAWALVPYTFNTDFSLSFLALGLERRMGWIAALGLLLLAALTLWWLPLWGLVGAAWAALIAEIGQSFCYLTLWLFQTTPKNTISPPSSPPKTSLPTAND